MNTSCRECGFPYDPGETPLCPKCDSGADSFGFIEALEIDVVHAGESWVDAKFKIERGLDKAILWHHKALKVIHGYGSLSGSAVIAPQAFAYLRHLAELHDGRFTKDKHTPGVSMIWLNRSPDTRPDSKSTSPSSSATSMPGNGWFEEAMKRAQDERAR